MEITVEHETRYRYPRPVSESYTIVHLQPRTTLAQYCTRFELDVVPDVAVFSYHDRFGNDVQHFSIVPEHQELRIVARSHVVTLGRGNPEPPNGVTAAWIEADPRTPELWDMRHASTYVDVEAARAFAAEIDAPADDVAAFFLAAGRHIHRTFTYRQGTTTVRTPVAEVIAAREGVCQDFAHVLIATARARGIPARYASGYIYSGGSNVLGAEASHAWAEAYLPPFGWVGFDPTNDRLVDDTFVLVALGRDYGDVSPTRGVYRGAAQGEMVVSVAVDARTEDLEQQQQEQQQQQ
ncbi:MAG TPA: transglutaminase family protein [Candidatus Baltobacteraceae bacterium]|nr:transglutaminase family protein [Candidatus Baltobacteraceae bacterium]